MRMFLSNPDNLQEVSPLQGFILESIGGCVVGGKRDKDGNLVLEEERPRLPG
jgi:hypothetical protein